MFDVTVTTTISASHHLRGYKGKCENPHGHNYRVEATVTGETQDKCGLALDFGVLRERLRDVSARFDHTDLNTCPEFAEINPSSENLARVIFKGLAERISDLEVQVKQVRIWETEGSYVTYYEHEAG